MLSFFNSESLAARLEWKSFFALSKGSIELKNFCKKDWEWKTETAAQIIILL